MPTNYSTNPDENTSIGGIDIGEGAPAGNMNDALRQLMADLANTNGGPFVLVISGQSNAAGANNGGPNPASSQVKTWDGTTGDWGGSDYNGAPWTHANPDGNSGHNNYALAAAHRIYEETGRPVYIIPDFVGGTSIAQWVGSGTASVRYAALKTKVQAALASDELEGITTVDAIIWAQGEEDGLISNFSTHITNLQTLDTQLRAEAWVDEFTPIYVTGMSNLHERYEIAPALREFATNSNGTWRYVASHGLKTSFDAGGPGDATHFLGPDLWEMGYDRIAPLILDGIRFNDEYHELPFYARGSGKITPADQTAISTFTNLVSWDSRTDGPGVKDTFTGDGSTTVFPLTSRGTVTSVTINGVTKTLTTDYTLPADGAIPYNITFTAAPANAAAIVVNYGAAINGPGSSNALSWGYRCFADGNYSAAGGYLSYTGAGCNYSFLWGRELTANDSADNSASFGYQINLQNTYQLAAGRGHTLAGSGEMAVGTYSKYTDGSRILQVGTGTSGAHRNSLGVNATQGNVEILAPAAAVDPGQNSELTFALTSNTTLVVKVRGTDGTVRSATLTLA
jgi:hypothetical protein